jgi:hypothetical protein
LRHHLARQAGQGNMARAALSPIACSWSGINRLTNDMGRAQLGSVVLNEVQPDFQPRFSHDLDHTLQAPALFW